MFRTKLWDGRIAIFALLSGIFVVGLYVYCGLEGLSSPTVGETTQVLIGLTIFFIYAALIVELQFGTLSRVKELVAAKHPITLGLVIAIGAVAGNSYNVIISILSRPGPIEWLIELFDKMTSV